MGISVVVRVIEQCCFNSAPEPFKDQTVNFILKPPKVKSQSEALLKQQVVLTKFLNSCRMEEIFACNLGEVGT